MLIGYSRTSTLEQDYGLEGQTQALQKYGVDSDFIFSEKVSSISDRPELQAAMRSLRKGDKLVVTKLCRFARSVSHLGKLLEEVEAKGANLIIVDMGVDSSTATGKLMLNVLGSVAQFEREVMLERQREGISRAKAEGKYKGRAPTAQRQKEKALALREAGVSMSQIIEQLKISRASYYRLIKT